MDMPELIDHTKRLIEKARNPNTINGVFAEVCQFLRSYAGPNSEFLSAVKEYNPRRLLEDHASSRITAILESFLSYLQAGLQEEISPERRAQLDVVSDILAQANSLLENPKVHPAAPIVLIGASLEEFLRTWVETEGFTLGNKKPGLESYAKVLKEEKLITKQDIKDIVSWAGLRNHAAHGEWDEVSDKNRAFLMLEGVNLFMRKSGA